MIDFNNPCVIEAVKRMRVKSKNHLSGYKNVTIEEVKEGYINNNPEIYWELIDKMTDVVNELYEEGKVHRHKKEFEVYWNKKLKEYKASYNYLKSK